LEEPVPSSVEAFRVVGLLLKRAGKVVDPVETFKEHIAFRRAFRASSLVALVACIDLLGRAQAALVFALRVRFVALLVQIALVQALLLLRLLRGLDVNGDFPLFPADFWRS